MKLKKIAYSILFFLVGIVFNSCNTEDVITPKKSITQKKEDVKHISISELFQDSNFSNSFGKIPIKAKTTSLKVNKTIMEHEYGFTIEEFKPANVTENDSLISYTLLIDKKSSKTNTISNLVINSYKYIDKVTSYIIEYESETPIANFLNFNGTRIIKTILYNTDEYTPNSTNKVYYNCITITYFICTNVNADHLPGGDGCEAPPITMTTCGFFDDNTSGGGGGDGTTTTTPSTTTTTGGSGGVITSPVYNMTPLELARKNFTKNLTLEQRTWINNENNLQASNAIFAYLEYSDSNTGELEYSYNKSVFCKQVIDVARSESNQNDVNSLTRISLILHQGNFEINPLNSSFLLGIDPYVEIDLTNQDIHDTIILQLIIKYNILKAANPNWSKSKLYWETFKDLIHTGLDVLGLAPVIGEPADLISGVIYSLEGDSLNATLSYASAIPIAGWVSTTTKYGLKVTNTVSTAYAISTKVKLTWKVSNGVLTFGQQSQLRKVLGMAASSIDPRQAHHLIPWATQAHKVIQKAAKSGSAFHMNEALNGIAVAAWRNQPNHNAYNNLIISKLEAFKRSNPNATPQECYNFLEDLIDQIRTWIINHPNSHLNDIVLP